MLVAALLALALRPSVTLIRGGTIYDGLGGPPFIGDVLVVGDKISAVGEVGENKWDKVIDAKGLAVSPGFIDAHSHADGGIFEDRDAETQVRQGITTAVVGEDGGSALPLRGFFDRLRRKPAAINFASFVGHGTIRSKVMGDSDRISTADERAQMASLVEEAMKDGALGVSTGLEYQPGRYGSTEEVVALARAASRHGGMYISHVRNEDDFAFSAFNELREVARRGKLPAQINHIKLGSASVWGRAKDVSKMMKENLDITADVYPYLYWQSTIRVLIATEEWDDREQWIKGLANIGGAKNVLLTRYTPDPTWAGKTVAEISTTTGKDPVTVIQEIIRKCYRDGNKGSESVVVTAMAEDDLRTFIADPRIMFCSDGGLRGLHPRGAGSFPRILGLYVREQKVIPLEEAIRKMTSLPAWRFGFGDRGKIAAGMKADLVIFNPATVIDHATTKEPQAKPEGIPTVLVNGKPVLLDGVVTHQHPGVPIRHRG